MQLNSPAFEPNQQIPARYTCDAENELLPAVLQHQIATTELIGLYGRDAQ